MSERSAAPGELALVESLVNTLDIESGADALDTADGRDRFGLTEDEVAGARELRESLRAALLAHAGHSPHASVTPLDDLLASAPLRVTVDTADGSAGLAPAGAARPLLSRVAAAIAGSLVEGTWPRLKACEAPTCHWAYYDRSPAGRGRWCSMQVCGARAKMRRYRAK
ncbi:CGNR zinc finger domain-containing protein [Streptomyces pseudovenezuelae]|uniref:RNA-binding Zn ribbon-like protein n=1 Tax=Streptomyces pseudovenezuelae TaxID=67350 RepID=A0ABT6LWK0_9ACTN|nr:CGNR zinc finger domain-containing protein [Streptomyces pseudovenezuelae]MDH6220632.1 putative RNA-binding Zn ribbon-like protein [Streptomyces pseudovenezuelae]